MRPHLSYPRVHLDAGYGLRLSPRPRTIVPSADMVLRCSILLQRLTILSLTGAALYFAFTHPGLAGTVAGRTDSCTLDASSPASCEWKPSHCEEPSISYIVIIDAASYNRAVLEYNAYLQQANRYLMCIVDEAKTDIQSNFPDAIKKSVDQLTAAVQRNADRAKNDLETSRPLLPK